MLRLAQRLVAEYLEPLYRLIRHQEEMETAYILYAHSFCNLTMTAYAKIYEVICLGVTIAADTR